MASDASAPWLLGQRATGALARYGCLMRKGTETHERILDSAMKLASRDGLNGLSIGALASKLGLSKSGLFAHFGSKEELQVQVLHAAAARFEAEVVRPAFAAPRGEPRLRALFRNWMDWAVGPAFPGGCIFIAASVELDDTPGPARDFLAQNTKLWLDVLARAFRIADEEKHLRASGAAADQLAFEVYGIALAFHQSKRLMRDPKAETRARAALDRLLDSVRP